MNERKVEKLAERIEKWMAPYLSIALAVLIPVLTILGVVIIISILVAR